MSLSAGTRLGPYEIQEPLGQGGMGQVFKALDTRLARTVAIKILAKDLADSPDLRQRFEREARAISSLTHPHVCTLYDVGHQDGIDFLVMEYLEGESLKDRLARGPLPLAQALAVATEIAGALERAHRQGIVHRDLKPGNVMLTKAGAKLLDFGLAKATPGGAAHAGLLASAEVTIGSPSPASSPLTARGTIVGTFQYMSPEQIEGLEADARSDLFAFGAVLYEMVTGRPAFEGKSLASIAAAILEREPPPISQLVPLAPAGLERLVRACLGKDPDERRQTAHDVLLDLRAIAEDQPREAPSQAHAAAVSGHSTTRGWRLTARKAGVLAVIVAGIVGLVGIGAFAASKLTRPSAPAVRTMRFAIATPSGLALGGSWYWYPSIALSPDGSVIAYVGHREGVSQLYLRGLDQLEPRPLAGTTGAHTPFFSPDGRWLGAYVGRKLVKIPTSGGPPVAIATVSGDIYGACWAPDDTIYFGDQSALGIMRVAAAGGTPTPVLSLRSREQETDIRLPELLPDGRTLLFVVRHGNQPSFDEADIAAWSPATGKRLIVIRSGSNPRFVAPGSLVFVRAGVLMAVGFDPATLQVKGEPTPVLEDVLENPRIGAGQFSVSADGSLVYIPGGITYGEHELVLVDKTGAARLLTSKTRPYEDFTISPDGRFIATTVEGAVTDTWIHDIARDTDSRFTYGVEHRDPAWTPDGRRIAYDGYKDGKYGIFWKSFDGSDQQETLVASDDPVYPWFWSPDGRFFVYASQSRTTGSDVWVLSREDRKARPLLNSPFEEEWGSFSPDGQWIAYNTDESGRPEVYVAPFPSMTPRIRISTEGGLHPLWAPNGRELYYRAGASLEAMVERTLTAGSTVMAVPVQTSPVFTAGTPRQLFGGPYFNSGHDWAITPDGKAFVMIREHAQTGPADFRLVLNWAAELRRRVAGNAPGSN